MLSHTSEGAESSPCGQSEEGAVAPHGERLALRAEEVEVSMLAMENHERTESKISIVSVASSIFPCWVCEHNPSIAFVARVSLADEFRCIHLCAAHEIEVAAVLLRWDR